MESENRNFKDLFELTDYIDKKKEGHILIGYQNVWDYPGMVLGLGIVFDVKIAKFDLDLEWISFGLDLYGENLLENYVYRFSSLQSLIVYLSDRYQIAVNDIPIRYEIQQSQFPDPIKNADQKSVYTLAWEKFQEDFKNGIFLDLSQQVVFSSCGKENL